MKEIKRYSISAHDFDLWDVATKSMASFSGEYPDEFYIASEADEALAALRAELAQLKERDRLVSGACDNATMALADACKELAQVREENERLRKEMSEANWMLEGLRK